MDFETIFSLQTIMLDATSQSKTAVLSKISHLISAACSTLQEKQLFDLFWKRENLGSTAIGHGVSIPHVRMQGINKTQGAFLRLQNPISFDADDKQPIDLIIGLVTPEHSTEEHLQILAALVERFQDPEFREACRAMQTNQALHHLLISNFKTLRAAHD